MAVGNTKRQLCRDAVPTLPGYAAGGNEGDYGQAGAEEDAGDGDGGDGEGWLRMTGQGMPHGLEVGAETDGDHPDGQTLLGGTGRLHQVPAGEHACTHQGEAAEERVPRHGVIREGEERRGGEGHEAEDLEDKAEGGDHGRGDVSMESRVLSIARGWRGR